MRHPYLLLVCFFLLIASYAFAENETEKTPEASKSPEVSEAAEPAPSATPKPELEAGKEADGVKLVLPGPFHFRKDEIGVDDVNVTFRVETSAELKEVKLDTNAYKALEIEICHDDARDKVLTPKDAPTDERAFSVFLTADSFYTGKIKNLEKYFDFEEGGRYWIRAKFNVEQKYAISDWAAIDIYTKACVTIDTREGSFTIWLRFDKAPNTCANFMTLVEKGYYDHLIFHRIMNRPNMKFIQGGCPHGDGSGGPGYTIDFEETGLKHEAGAVAMARQKEKNTAGAQFYVCAEPIPDFDGNYCVFGKVIEGLNTIKKIAAVETLPTNPEKPKYHVEMQSLTIEYRK